MAMRLFRTLPDLSEQDFIDLDEKVLSELKEPIDVLAFVAEYDIKRLENIKKSMKIEKEKGYNQPVSEFKDTDARLRKNEERKATKPEHENTKVEHVSLTDNHMLTRASARAKGKEIMVDDDLKWHVEKVPAEAEGTRGTVNKNLRFRIRRVRAKEESVNVVDKMEIEETTDGLEKLEIEEGSSSSSSLHEQVSNNSKGRKRSKKQSTKKPEKKSREEAIAITSPEPQSALPGFFQERIAAMGGVNPVLLLQKGLFLTDLSKQQNRLSIPLRAMRTKFFTDEEMTYLSTTNVEKRCNSIETVFLDTKGNTWIMPLRLWEMKKDGGTKSSKMCVLTHPWHKMAVDYNGLGVGDIIQLWAFRMGEKIGFALVKL